MVGKQQQCKSSVDADLTVTLDSGFYSGTMTGYLQAKAPAFLKLVGVNPFGLPLLVLVSDGKHFDFALLEESLIYAGDVDSAAFQRFVPTGVDPGSSFYILTGKLAPGEVRIIAVSNDSEGRGAWLELEHIQNNIHSMVLFDPDQQLIRQYRQFDEKGRMTLKIVYSDHDPESCRLPALITITSSDHAGELVVRLSGWRTDASFSTADFALELPKRFKRVQVN
jgi:hypothetical protein